jgi:DNA mismatch repair protein MutS
MSFINDYFTKIEKYTEDYGFKTILLAQVGAFFEVYGLRDDNKHIISNYMNDFSSICDLNIVDKKSCSGSKNIKVKGFDVVMAGFKTQFLDKFIKKLQDAGYTSVVLVQDEQAPNTTRSLLGIYSPGTFFTPDSDTITNNTTCIWIELLSNSLLKSSAKSIIYVGVSNIDIYTGKTSIFEFEETYVDNPTTFDELERFVSIYNPSECIFVYDNTSISRQQIDNIVKYVNLRSNAIHYIDSTKKQRVANCQKQIYQKELLEKFYYINDFSSFIQDYNQHPISTQSFCFLLDFIYQHNPNLVNKIAEPIFENFGDRLILATHSLKQLNIVDDYNYKGKYSSVSKMLNECVSSMGKRKFHYNFLNPTTNINYLQSEYDITDHLLKDTNKFKHIRMLVSNIKDISKFNRSIILKKITPKMIYQLYNNLLIIRDLYNYTIADSVLVEYMKKCIQDFDFILDHTNNIISFLEKSFCIDMCANSDVFETMFIQSGVNVSLDTKYKEYIESSDTLDIIRIYFNDLLASNDKPKKSKSTPKKVFEEFICDEYIDTNLDVTNFTNLDVVNLDEEKAYVRTYETEKNNITLISTETRCKKIKELLPEKDSTIVLEYDSKYTNNIETFQLFIGKNVIEFHKQSSSNTSINSNQINNICRTLTTSKIAVKELVYKTYQNIITSMESFYQQLECISEFITYLDLIQCKAFIANKYNYCKPVLDQHAPKSFINVQSIRHCLIENIQHSELYVANDIQLGINVIDGILLYGTNAVGKTSFIRSIGVSIIMAQAGLYVPASSFIFKPYKYIFTRILGNDNLFEGLSTFAVEMSELRTILRLSNSDSLVLGDELCSGTESTSAVSIFVAGIQALASKTSSFIFATHLHEIVDFDEILSLKNVSMKHMEVKYDKERDLLVYDRKLKDGPGNSMYGLEVCKSLGLPFEFLETANNIRMKYHPESSSILDKKQSKYNSKNVKTMCENCKIKVAKETHHLVPQQEANSSGKIETNDLVFHKNHQANLLNLCEECHDKFHLTTKKHKKVKTTKGTIIQEV